MARAAHQDLAVISVSGLDRSLDDNIFKKKLWLPHLLNLFLSLFLSLLAKVFSGRTDEHQRVF